MKNIVLVGFMGTGKTAVARKLSEKLGIKYVSTDDLIKEREKADIADIFAKKGEAYFRKVERSVIEGASTMENIVLDAGGGAVMDPDNVKDLKKKGIIVCLWVEPDIILERTKKYTHRPLLNVDNPLAKIKELLAVRKPFYDRADHHIYASKMTVEEVANEIERIISNG